MAFHEQHERECPACGARISATAPKCFNCGRLVDDEGDGAGGAPGGNPLVIVVVGVVVVALAIAAAYLF